MKLKISHYIGGIFLVSGTTIGAGMLALPIATAFLGFFPSLLVFFICWLFMLSTAFFFLDVNLSIKGDINLISMAHKTLGLWGKVVSWLFYLLLLYSLTAAYIAASAPLFQNAIAFITGWKMPGWLAPFSLPLIFGGFIYFGTLGVDLINRMLMFGLIISYVMLVGLAPSQINPSYLHHVDFSYSLIAIPIILTSFGYHIIIPSLTTYMKHNRKRLIWIIIVGSVIPLVVYILWQFLVLGTVPLIGKVSLLNAYLKGVSATQPLSIILKNPLLSRVALFFSFFAIVTSFLGVSLSLSDFLTDGFKIQKRRWESRLLALLLTFVPPLVFVFTYKRGFIVALEYAGAFVAILLGFLPAMMAWHLKKPIFYRTIKGRLLLFSVIILSLLMVLLAIFSQIGFFQGFVTKYTQMQELSQN